MSRLKRMIAIIFAFILFFQPAFGIMAELIYDYAHSYAASSKYGGSGVDAQRNNELTDRNPYNYSKNCNIYAPHLIEGDILDAGVMIHTYGRGNWGMNEKPTVQSCMVYDDNYKNGEVAQEVIPGTPYTTAGSVKVKKLVIEPYKHKLSGKTVVTIYLEKYTVTKAKNDYTAFKAENLKKGSIIKSGYTIKKGSLTTLSVFLDGANQKDYFDSDGDITMYNNTCVSSVEKIDGDSNKLKINLETYYGTSKIMSEAQFAAALGDYPKLKLAGSFTVTEPLVIDNKDYSSFILDLNGCDIERVNNDTQDDNGSVIILDNGIDLSIRDTSKGEPGNITGGNAKFGGGILVKGGSKLTTENINISGNKAQYGGGICVTDGSKVVIEEGTLVSDNEANYGGGINVYKGNCEVTDSSMLNNKAKDGGGIYNSKDAKLDISDTEILNNYLNGGYGGGLLNEGECIIKNSRINNNTNASCGGGLSNYATLTIEDCTISSNSVTENGGGIEINDGTNSDAKTTFSGSNKITGNSAKRGGGIYVNADKGTEFHNKFNDITISNNNADETGGAAFIDKNVEHEVTFENAVIESNNAGTKGGAIYTESPLNLVDTSIRLNCAKEDGGAVYIDYDNNKYKFNINNTSIQENICNGTGGGIYMHAKENTARMVLKGGLIVINTNKQNITVSDSQISYDSNVYFDSFKEIEVDEKLEKDSKIGIAFNENYTGKRTVTRGYAEKNTDPPDIYFTYDGADYKIVQDDKVAELEVENRIRAEAKGYKIKVEVKVTNDADDWDDAHIEVWSRDKQGLGSQSKTYETEDIKGSLDHGDGEYTLETDCGTSFPSSINVYANFGGGGVYRCWEADVTVWINGVNTASMHINRGLWGNTKKKDQADNWLTISGNKYPYPEEIEIIQKREIELLKDETKKVSIDCIDQYGVKYIGQGKDNFTMENISFPKDDTFKCLDEDSGMKWSFDSSNTTTCHNSTYVLKIKSGSNINEWVEIPISVRFKVGLNLKVRVGNDTKGYKTVLTKSGYEGDKVHIDNLNIDTGYKIEKYETDNKACDLVLNSDDTYDFYFKTGSVVITFVTKAIKYKVVYSNNASSSKKVTGKVATVSQLYDEEFVIADCGYNSVDGYTFYEWNTKADGSGKSYKPGDIAKNLSSIQNEKVKLYAQWKDKNGTRVTASLYSSGTAAIQIGLIIIVIISIVIGCMASVKRRDN